MLFLGMNIDFEAMKNIDELTLKADYWDKKFTEKINNSK